MKIICPTITAYNTQQYKEQIIRLKPFADRIHIDLMDGHFAPTKSPTLSKVWWPHEFQADIHLMYQEPMKVVDQLIHLQPHMVVIHNEAHVHHMEFAAKLHAENIKVGLAILRETPIEWAYQIMHSFDHVLIFSGNLGHHGGEADLGLLDKVHKAKHHHPEVEIGWDGGINDKNIEQMAEAGVSVFNVGGFIQGSRIPAAQYQILDHLV